MPTLLQVSSDQGSSVDPLIDRTQVALVIPTYNAGTCWQEFQPALAAQRFLQEQVLIIDSSSTDGTAEAASAEGYQVVQINNHEFNHGGTRQLALDFLPWAKFVVYLTQDAILAKPDSVESLLAPFQDPD